MTSERPKMSEMKNNPDQKKSETRFYNTLSFFFVWKKKVMSNLSILLQTQ